MEPPRHGTDKQSRWLLTVLLGSPDLQLYSRCCLVVSAGREHIQRAISQDLSKNMVKKKCRLENLDGGNVRATLTQELVLLFSHPLSSHFKAPSINSLISIPELLSTQSRLRGQHSPAPISACRTKPAAVFKLIAEVWNLSSDL